MIKPYEAARIILPTLVRVEPKNPNSETYLAILLARERSGGKYILPGGRIEAGMSKEKTAQKELKEELGLHVELSDLDFAFSYQASGSPCHHHAFLARCVTPLAPHGELHLNYEVDFGTKKTPEILNLGFYDIGRESKRLIIPKSVLGRSVSEGLEDYITKMEGKGVLGTLFDCLLGREIRPTAGLVIDGKDYAPFYQHIKSLKK